MWRGSTVCGMAIRLKSCNKGRNGDECAGDRVEDIRNKEGVSFEGWMI